jgi:hypothetical protein
MKYPPCLPCLCLLISTLPAVSAAPPDGPVWESLFNGRDWDGWSIIEPPVRAEIKDGSMVLRPTPHTSRHAFIRTNREFQDFIFEIEFRHDRKIDSGVLFRAEAAPPTAWSALHGYMVKIDPQPQRLWTGGIFVDFGNSYAWLQTLEGDERARRAEKPAGEWNLLRIEAFGEELKVWLNGIPTAHILDEKYRAGYLALKIHFLNNDGAGFTGLELAYRNARVITANPRNFAQPMDLPAKDTRGPLHLTTFR